MHAQNQVTAAGSEPYGDVSYADPGYQDDKKKRYPLDSEAHCRAAWSYINQSGNAGKYSPEQLKRIKSRIKAAGKKYGIEFADEGKVTATAGTTTIVMNDTGGRELRDALIADALKYVRASGGELPEAMRLGVGRGRRDVWASSELRDIELARPGTWKLASGPLTVDAEMLADAARFANRTGARPGYLKIGHTDTRFMAADGEPALGWLHNIRLEEDDEGEVLMGDLTDVPEWLATAIPKHWPDRSIEGYADYEHDGERYGLVVDGLALLGVTPPGMSSIKSLRDLPQALGLPVAASNGTRIVASFGDPHTPAPVAEEPTIKGAGMSLVKYREALAGLPDDASEEDVMAALNAVGFVEDGGDAELAPRVPSPVAAAAASGAILLDPAQYNALRVQAKRGDEAWRLLRENECDRILTEAVKAGKFPPARRDHWKALWAADPDGTKSTIESLAANVIPVMASGYSGVGEDTEQDLIYSAMYPESRGGDLRG